MKYWTRDEALDWFAEHFQPGDTAPGSKRRRHMGGPGCKALVRMFGSADQAYREAGLVPPSSRVNTKTRMDETGKPYWTRERIAEWLIDYRAEHGHTPGEVRRHRANGPTNNDIQREYGRSLARAYQEIGVAKPRPGLLDGERRHQSALRMTGCSPLDHLREQKRLGASCMWCGKTWKPNRADRVLAWQRKHRETCEKRPA